MGESRRDWDAFPVVAGSCRIGIPGAFMSISPGIHSVAIGEVTRRAEGSGYAGKPSASAIGLIGRDPAILELVDLAKQVADTAATVLITGESGSGKEILAQIIRRHSGHRSAPFVAVNCGAIAEPLQESEFFGHVRGAFTGASERKIGKLERANGGTIFLDEIGEMSKSLQAALLRTLQSGEYSPVGSSETKLSEVRVIAAANRDLTEMMDAGEFRRDLYYRLNIIRPGGSGVAGTEGRHSFVERAFHADARSQVR